MLLLLLLLLPLPLYLCISRREETGLSRLLSMAMAPRGEALYPCLYLQLHLPMVLCKCRQQR